MRLRSGLLLLAALALGSRPIGARADNLDNRLNEKMPDVVKKLREKGYKNVGVLRFLVKEGERPAGFTTPLSGTMVTRVETFLIVHDGPDEEKAIGVIADAAAVAGKNKIASWSDSLASRRKMFDVDYPLAWGNKKVKPDAFITGQVITSKSGRKTLVKLQSFDSKAPNKLVDLASFEMKTDRDIRRDLGHSFALGKETRKKLFARRGVPEKEVEDMLWDENPTKQSPKPDTGKKDPKPKPKPKAKRDILFDEEETAKDVPVDDPTVADPKKTKPAPITPDNIGGIAVQLLAGEDSQEIRESGAQADAVKFQLECPRPGKEISFQLKNTSNRRLGVVLRLNGLNTINQQTDEPERCGKWVLDPKEVLTIKGFYLVKEDSESGKKTAKRGDEDGPKADDDDDKRLKPEIIPFKILVGEAAKLVKADMGDKAGLIEIDVFEVGSAKQEMKLTGKGLPPKEKQKEKESYIRLRNATLKHARLQTKISPFTKREVIVPGPKARPPLPGEGLKLVSFPNPQVVAHLVIRVVPPEPAPGE